MDEKWQNKGIYQSDIIPYLATKRLSAFSPSPLIHPNRITRIARIAINSLAFAFLVLVAILGSDNVGGGNAVVTNFCCDSDRLRLVSDQD